MSSSWSGPPPEQIAAWTVVQAGHAVGARFRAALSDVGFTPTQFGALLQLDLLPDSSNAALARAVLVTPQTMSELLAALEDRRLVTRRPPVGRGHPTSVRLTAAGRQALRRCAVAVAEVEASLGLSPEELRQLNGLLHTAIAGGQADSSH